MRYLDRLIVTTMMTAVLLITAGCALTTLPTKNDSWEIMPKTYTAPKNVQLLELPDNGKDSGVHLSYTLDQPEKYIGQVWYVALMGPTGIPPQSGSPTPGSNDFYDWMFDKGMLYVAVNEPGAVMAGPPRAWPIVVTHHFGVGAQGTIFLVQTDVPLAAGETCHERVIALSVTPQHPLFTGVPGYNDHLVAFPDKRYYIDYIETAAGHWIKGPFPMTTAMDALVVEVRQRLQSLSPNIPLPP